MCRRHVKQRRCSRRGCRFRAGDFSRGAQNTGGTLTELRAFRNRDMQALPRNQIWAPIVGGGIVHLPFRATDHRWKIVYATTKHLPFSATDHRWKIGTCHEGCSGEGRPQEADGCGCGCGCGCRVESKLSQKILLLTYTHTHTHTHTLPAPEDGLPPNTLRDRSHISTGGRWPEKEGILR